ncbi:MAG: hypothetical protein HWE30_14700 [Methylocystaceae bacterium]|nr:hypothetical protein [Methylocystaceae bacterium]
MLQEKTSSGLFFCLSLLTILAEVLELEVLADIAICLALGFLVLEFRSIGRLPKIIGSSLLILGAGLAFYEHSLVDLIHTGLRKTLPFLLLFASVTWLQAPSSYSPSLLNVRRYVVNQPSGRRFLFLSFAAHLLGAAFNLASFSLLSPMIKHVNDPNTKSRLVRAMSFGFGTATCWSPFFVGTVIVLSLVPKAPWTDVAPYGISIGLVLLLLGWMFDRIYFRKNHEAYQATATPARFQITPFLKTLLVLSLLFASVILVSETLHWKISISLAVVAPIFSLIWLLTISTKEKLRVPTIIYEDIFKNFRSLRGETFLFMSANIFGVCFSSFIQHTPLDIQDTLASLSPHVTLILIMVSFLFTSAIGLHPVIYVVVLTSILSPENTGIPPLIFALCLISMWGQGTNISPLSATVIYLSGVTKQSNFKIAWRWHSPFSLLASIMIAIILQLLLLIQ